MLEGMGPDQPTIITKNGAGMSDIPYRMDLIDAKALMAAAKVLHHGAEKYGPGNWRDLPIHDHLNHLLAHVYAYLAGDDQDEHLTHVLCRALFALGCELDGKKLEIESERNGSKREEASGTSSSGDDLSLTTSTTSQ